MMAVNVDPSQVLAIALANVPTMVIVCIGILFNNSRLTDLRATWDGRFNDVGQRFNDVEKRLDGIDRRLDRMDHRLETIESDQREFFLDLTRLKEKAGIS